MRTLAALLGACCLVLVLRPAGGNQLFPPPPSSHILVVGSGNPATLYDFSQAGSVVQSSTIPGCTLGTAGNAAYGSSSADGGFAMISCGTTSSPNDDRLIVRIDPNGVIDTSTMIQSYRDAYLPRGVASMDGQSIYAADGA